MMLDFTVAIPTYNGANRLPKLLNQLRSQHHTDHISWEIIVIDNNSNDNTAEVIQTYQSDWLHPYCLKYFFEPKQGLAFARQRAIQEANSPFIGFLDDDILPNLDWVSAAFSFSQTQPKMGAYGGQIHAAFETQPPENFKRIQSFLAVREKGNQPTQYQPKTLSLPPGAALVIRREAWFSSVPQQLNLIGRVNQSMLAGEDYEALLYLYKAGWEIWYCPTMHTFHQIPSYRLEREYLVTLARGAGLCIAKLRMINAKGWEKPEIFLRILLGNLRKMILHLLKYRVAIRTDPIAACEMEFFWSSFLSPFYNVFTRLVSIKVVFLDFFRK